MYVASVNEAAYLRLISRNQFLLLGVTFNIPLSRFVIKRTDNRFELFTDKKPALETFINFSYKGITKRPAIKQVDEAPFLPVVLIGSVEQSDLIQFWEEMGKNYLPTIGDNIWKFERTWLGRSFDRDYLGFSVYSSSADELERLKNRIRDKFKDGSLEIYKV